MDKRTILFVLLVGATFFGLNLFFGHQRDAQNRERLILQEAQAEKISRQNLAEAEKRTAKLTDLPIVELFSDKEEKQKIAYGIALNHGTLTLSWEQPLPQVIYVNQQEQHLLSKETVVEGPALYGTNDFESISIASLPSTGTYDVQLVTFPVGYPPQIFWGLYQGGSLSIPQGAISENAIALYRTGNDWLPLGFYEWRGRVLIELQNLPLLTQYIKSSAFKNPVPSAANAEQKFYV